MCKVSAVLSTVRSSIYNKGHQLKIVPMVNFENCFVLVSNDASYFQHLFEAVF